MFVARVKHLLVVAVLLAASIPSIAAQSENSWTGQVSVIDGDTLGMGKQRFRLHGIDAPESGQSCKHPERGTWRCGQQAALALADQIGRAHVTCRQTDKDRYGRIIAICALGSQDLNQWMVRSGWAVAYLKYSHDYAADEIAAKQAGMGIWSGEFVSPSAWRRGERLHASTNAEASGDCRIKGNINSKGKRIYHLPGMRWYANTRINEAQGERWFCTEAEARRAGWTKSNS